MIQRTLFNAAALAIWLGAIPLAVLAQSDNYVNGQVTKIDESAGKITIKHGPLKKFDMNEGMTMVFRAGDPAAVFSHYGPKTERLKRENELLQREVSQLRETVGLERSLKDLREQVEVTKNQVPRVPELVSGLKEDQADLRREIATTRDALKRAKIAQALTDRRVAKLDETTRARAASIEM
jgi:Cu/Ag efflux protein CusF